jgi:hypothetical protein
MSGVRVLVGTRKFGGWEVYHVKGSPVDPNRIYASQSTGWFGQLIQRSDDGGAPGSRWATSSTTTACRHAPVVRRHAAPVGVRPSLAPRALPERPRHVLAGVEDAALFRSTDGGENWSRAVGTAHPRHRRPGNPGPAACACTRSSSVRRTRADLRRHLRGRRLSQRRRGPRGDRSTADFTPRASPTRTRRSATACTASRCTRRVPTCSTCKSTGT